MIEVHCLKCDHVWGEQDSPDACPNCGNPDKQQTAYQVEELAHDFNCPAIDGFGCRCNESMEKTND